MKVLMLTEEFDIFFHFLLESLNNIDMKLAHAQFPISQEDIAKYDPDIIIHNVKNIHDMQYREAITISINELDEKNCFSYKNNESENYIKPFVKPYNMDLSDSRYKSDVVYIGNPNLLPDTVVDLQKDINIKFKIINNFPAPIAQYCGSANFHDYKKFFHMSKCSLVNKIDSDLENYSFKLLDIIYAGGNPVLHEDDDDKFIADVRDALDGKCFRDEFMSRQEILSNYTNHDRMSEIFSKVGLNKISTMILNSKGK